MKHPMLEIFKSRLPEGVEVKKVKNKPSQLEITLSYEGVEATTWIYKTCVPGKAEQNCDFSITTAMAQIYFTKNNYEMVQYWLRKQSEIGKGA